MKVKAVLFGAVTVITAGLVFLTTRKANAAPPVVDPSLPATAKPTTPGPGPVVQPAKPPVVQNTSYPPYDKVEADQNGMKWHITRPHISTWRAQQMPIDVTGEGAWQDPYPEESNVVEAPTYDVLKNRVEAIAYGYES